ncbi:unnamed protein product [Porites evermanni]|uniref:G-protein coupled receptors family 1 profile domain-containing protein n=1 Tax=Porites evermanni TaxID=104178 RepID=A0ABN8MI32_9CNID|nr:unnamed protein product [Porites evermanni]
MDRLKYWSWWVYFTSRRKPSVLKTVNLLSIILFIKNSNLCTRAMYLVINLTVVDMFVEGVATFAIVFHFLLYGCEVGNKFIFHSKQFLAAQEWQPFLVLLMIDIWLSLTSVAGIAVISLDRMHATFHTRFSFLTYVRLRSSFTLLRHTNSLVNPIIYIIRIPEFRKALLILFKRRQRQNVAIPLHAR